MVLSAIRRATRSREASGVHECPIFVDEEMAPAPTRKIFDELKRTFGMPVVNSDYRALARWPDFLQAYWDVLKPINCLAAISAVRVRRPRERVEPRTGTARSRRTHLRPTCGGWNGGRSGRLAGTHH